MTQVLSRLYATDAKANACEEELRRIGFRDVFVTRANVSGGKRSKAETVEALIKAYVLRSDAEALADKLGDGAIVTVHAMFPHGGLARSVLNEFEPEDLVLDRKPAAAREWDERTPMSSALQFAPLTKTRLPFEAIWNVRSLTRKPTGLSACVGMKTLSDNRTPMTSMLGMRSLSPNKTPLSSRLGLSTLSDKQTVLYNGPKRS